MGDSVYIGTVIPPKNMDYQCACDALDSLFDCWIKQPNNQNYLEFLQDKCGWEITEGNRRHEIGE
jgi:hypothetical protein